MLEHDIFSYENMVFPMGLLQSKGSGQGATILRKGTTKSWRGFVVQREARLPQGSCTVQYKHLDMYTVEHSQLNICIKSVQCCSARPKPKLSQPNLNLHLSQPQLKLGVTN